MKTQGLNFSFRLTRGFSLVLFTPHYIHHSNSSDLHYGVDVVSCLQYMDRRAHAQQDGTNRFGLAQPGQQLIGDIRGFKRGEDQHIRVFHCAERIAGFDDFRHHRGIGLHLTIHLEVWAAGLGQLDGAAHLI
jgi:hypothetical protein